MKKECSSRICWWEEFERLAEAFAVFLNDRHSKKPGFIELDIGKLRYAFEMYEFNWGQFKDHVYGKVAEEKRIDRHKIASLYILAILTECPFAVRGIHPDDRKLNPRHLLDLDNRYLLFANELFAMAMMRDIVFSWSEDRDDDKPFGMEENEKTWFMILLNSFRLKLESKSDAKQTTEFDEPTVLSLSQVIYYIEEVYLNRY